MHNPNFHIDEVNKLGETALHIAVEKGWLPFPCDSVPRPATTPARHGWMTTLLLTHFLPG